MGISFYKSINAYISLVSNPLSIRTTPPYASSRISVNITTPPLSSATTQGSSISVLGWLL
jgi:hypothetical protein